MVNGEQKCKKKSNKCHFYVLQPYSLCEKKTKILIIPFKTIFPSEVALKSHLDHLKEYTTNFMVEINTLMHKGCLKLIIRDSCDVPINAVHLKKKSSKNPGVQHFYEGFHKNIMHHYVFNIDNKNIDIEFF